VLTTGVDTFLALASIVADELYGRPLPIVALTPVDFAALRTGADLTITSDGAVAERST
jgi:predicted aconitase with swiveling domain